MSTTTKIDGVVITWNVEHVYWKYDGDTHDIVHLQSGITLATFKVDKVKIVEPELYYECCVCYKLTSMTDSKYVKHRDSTKIYCKDCFNKKVSS